MQRRTSIVWMIVIAAVAACLIVATAPAQDGAGAMGHPHVPRVPEAKGGTSGQIIEAEDWDSLPMRSLTVLAGEPLDWISMEEAALVVRAFSPHADYWLLGDGMEAVAHGPGLTQLAGGLGIQPEPGDTLRPGMYFNLTAHTVAVLAGGEEILVDPGEAVAVGVRELAHSGGEKSVDCDDNHFACCSSKGFKGGKYALCRALGQNDDDCETGGHGSTGCTVTVPSKKDIRAF